MTTYLDTLQQLWQHLYDNQAPEQLQNFLQELQAFKQIVSDTSAQATTWYKDAVVYSTYVDLFNGNLTGLRAKLPYLQELGITCLWLLPILESPMKDAGFDIADFDAIRADVLGLPPNASPAEKERVFGEFLNEAHQRGIRVIFDIAINHTSVEHAWFQAARQSPTSPKRHYYIWSDTPDRFPAARLLMKGMQDSNWAWDEVASQYYLHRFFDIQPDLNYRTPAVLLEMTRMLLRWKMKGVDGFRADAVPFLWKADNTTCESLPQVHTIIKFFRAALDYVQPGTLILAEACQPPNDVVAYFGHGDECQAAYHFPVMPRIFRALAEERAEAIEMVMDPAFTPHIPENCQWFMFLRCHDELSLEMVTPEERTFVYNHYATDPRWNYRQGEGISARLATLFHEDLRKIRLAYSIMLTLTGTPIIYYGDEFAKTNDDAFYQEMLARTGFPDSRYYARGRIDWERVAHDLRQPDTLAYQVYQTLRRMLAVRKQHPAFSRGTLEFVRVADSADRPNLSILAYRRCFEGDQRLILHNLSAQEQQCGLDEAFQRPADLLDQAVRRHDDGFSMPS
ncbi:MAG: alpha-amylase family glycosyl hydrolase, partial [Desulfobacterales bacterium]